MTVEMTRIDCPVCGTERGIGRRGKPRLICVSCAHDRAGESSRLNHHAHNLRHRAVPENPAEPAVIDGAAEDLRTATLRHGQAVQARGPEVARAKVALDELLRGGAYQEDRAAP